jgi:hypothetical protein
MRTWTKSACVVLAWSILSIILGTVGMKGSVHLAQANTRTASSTEITEVTLTSALSVATAPGTATSPTTRYVMQHGDTLSGIAARSAVRGGWPALYTAGRQAIGPNPNATHPGTMLTAPRPAAPSPPTPGISHRWHPTPPPSPPPGPRHHPSLVTKGAPAATGMPRWLKTLLLAVSLFILVAFLAEPVLVVRRRRQQAAVQALRHCKAGSRQGPGSGPTGADKTRIVVADHNRLVVTRSETDGTVYVLRPPGEDPKAILRVARLVLPEDRYEELAEELGMPAGWPKE